MNQGNNIGASSTHPISQSKEFNADEFTNFLANLPLSIDHLKRENGVKYGKYVMEGYKRIVSFLKKHQDKIKVATDRDQLNEILTDIFQTEMNVDQKRLALDANTLTKFPPIDSIFKSNAFADGVRLYLRNIHRRLKTTEGSDPMKLASFYEEKIVNLS